MTANLQKNKNLLASISDLRSRYNDLYVRLDSVLSADQWVGRAVNRALLQLDEMELAIAQMAESHVPVDISPHKLSYKAICDAQDWDDAGAADSIKAWRRNLGSLSYTDIPVGDRKGLFDYFFRYDVHGHLENDETIFLSRGVNAPEYFAPPSIVNVAIDVASRNNWFGYSDSLGYIETREAIARLEIGRRQNALIDYQNVAVIQGGTAGLHAVLAMLAKETTRRNCVLAMPTYAPIADEVRSHFNLRTLDLNTDYKIDPNELLSAASDPDTAVLLLSVPHNPAGGRVDAHLLELLQDCCRRHGTYLIIDEIAFDPAVSPLVNLCPYTLVVSSYSKTYNIPGLKLGHLLADADFINRFYRHASTTYGSPTSFTYLVATCLALAEDAARRDIKVVWPEQVLAVVSTPDLLDEEFSLWRQLRYLQQEFENCALRQILLTQQRHAVAGVFGLDDPSPNIVLRLNTNTSAYQAFLDIMAHTNVALMPIECFVPSGEWPCDLRVTLSIAPLSLVRGLSGLVSFLNDYCVGGILQKSAVQSL